MLLFLCLFNTTGNGKRSLENKMDSPKFIDEEDIPLVHQDDDDDDDDDYDDYNTPDSSRIEETSFIEPNTTEIASALKLR